MVNLLSFEIPDSFLTLRELSLDNASELFALIDANREHLSQYGDTTSSKYPDLMAVEQSILNPKNPDRRSMGIFDTNGYLVGTINFQPHDESCAEVVYWIGSQFSGKGIMTAATTGVVDYIINGLGFNSVLAYIHKDNIASRKVVEKCRFTLINSNQVEQECLAYVFRAPRR